MRHTFCIMVPAILGLVIAGAGGRDEPSRPGAKPKVIKEQVRG